MRKFLSCLLIVGSLILPAAQLRAAWNPGDPHKMHYPQLPDVSGLDVSFEPLKALADDWRCAGMGTVDDIHFWFSARDDATPAVDTVHVSICADVPQDPTTPYSRPGEVLWSADFNSDQFTWNLAGQGDLGWYVPETGFFDLHDHVNYYQLDIENIIDPFVQTEDQIYWLQISVSSSVELGWCTSDSPQFNDAATWGNLPNPVWEPVYDPRIRFVDPIPMDFAFVITPEPASCLLLGLAGLIALRRR